MRVHERVLAARTLLLESTTSRQKFEQIRTLLKGINPKVDSALQECGSAFKTIENMISGDVVSLAVDHLPENTEEEKRRKKVFLIFWNSWNTLKSEVARVEKELADGKNQQASAWERIFGLAKGPLGIITIVAVGIVLTLQAVSVRVAIHNDGCDTIIPEFGLPFSLPGLSVPDDPIKTGNQALARVPGLTVTVDGTNRSQLKATVLGYTASYDSSGADDVLFDGASLVGKVTVLELSKQKNHDLVFKCR